MTHLTEYPSLPFATSSFSVTELAKVQVQTFERCAIAQRARHSTRVWCYSHLTALELLGIEIPRLSAPGRRLNLNDIHVCESQRAGLGRYKTVTTHLWNHPFSPVLVAGELLVVPPITAWAQISPYIDEEELTVLGDSMMRRNPLLKKATLHEFEDYLAQTHHFVGKQNCVQALKYMSENTDSSQESRLRYALQKEGFAAPVANYRVVVPGTPLSYLIDMAWPNSKVGIEYDGAYHFDAHQRSLDSERQRDLEALGWQIIHVSAGQLSDDSHIRALVAQVIGAFASNELL